MTKQLYSVGFLHSDESVVLIKKNRPDWQSGKYNGVGGHVEENEKPHDAMVREFQEETGVLVPRWQHFVTLAGPNAMIYCYAANDNGDAISRVKTMTDEEIKVVSFFTIENHRIHIVPNLRWIIPLMRQRDKYDTILVPFLGDS